MTRVGRNGKGNKGVTVVLKTFPGKKRRKAHLYLWAGSWSFIASYRCAHCYNLYVGPFGVEIIKKDSEGVT